MSTNNRSLPSNEFYTVKKPLSGLNFSLNQQGYLLEPRHETLRAKQPTVSNHSFATANTATFPSHTNLFVPATQPSTNEYAAPAGAMAGPISGPLATIQQHVEDSLNDEVAPVRLAGHISVLLVAVIVLVVSQMNLASLDVKPSWLSNNVQDGTSQLSNGLFGSFSLGKLIVPLTEFGSVNANVTSDVSPAVVQLETPQKSQIRQHTTTHSVLQGETVLGIAEKFKLQPETIQWSNPQIAKNPDLLRVGDNLVIPPVDGVLYTIKPDDTLLSIASSHKVSLDDILSFSANSIANAAQIQPGNELMIPGGVPAQKTASYLPYNAGSTSTAAVPNASGKFNWPYRGEVSQRYWSGHPALDIGGWAGSPVTAADSGKVTIAAGGWNGGYGRHVIIDHGNGFATLYAHLNTIYVNHGQTISKGQEIGSLGNTGNSTGPHLHFEIRYNGRPQNPFNYLN